MSMKYEQSHTGNNTQHWSAISQYNNEVSSNQTSSNNFGNSQINYYTRYSDNSSSSSHYEDDSDDGLVDCRESLVSPITPATPKGNVNKPRGSQIIGIVNNSTYLKETATHNNVTDANACPQNGQSTSTEISSQNVSTPASENESIIFPKIRYNSMAFTPGSHDVMNSPIGIAPISLKKTINPIEQVQNDMRVFQGGDNIFALFMSNVSNKSTIALSDVRSAYLFRDFAGNFSEFLDRFGPGCYDSHRAPKNISWIIKLILPWLYMCYPSYEDQLTSYEEVCEWTLNLVMMLGAENKEEILENGLWDTCCDQMAHCDIKVSKKAYLIIREIIITVKLDKHLVNKVLLLRNTTLGFEDVEMFQFRRYRIELIINLLERIDSTLSPEVAVDLINNIIYELKYSASVETNPKTKVVTDDCLLYANNILISMSVFEPKYDHHSKVFHFSKAFDTLDSSDRATVYPLSYSGNIIPYNGHKYWGDHRETSVTKRIKLSINNQRKIPKISKRKRFWNKLSKVAHCFHSSPSHSDTISGSNTSFMATSLQHSQENLHHSHRSVDIINTLRSTFRRKKNAYDHTYQGIEDLFEDTFRLGSS